MCKPSSMCYNLILNPEITCKANFSSNFYPLAGALITSNYFFVFTLNQLAAEKFFTHYEPSHASLRVVLKKSQEER